MNSIYTFDNFIIGSSNRFAAAVCREAAENKGRPYNPLWLYGPSGCGKSHLARALVQEAVKRDENTGVLYLSAEEIAEHLISAAKGKAPIKIGEADVLVVDNAEILSGKGETLKALAQIFLGMQEQGRQAVLVSNCVPAALEPMKTVLLECEHTIFADVGLPEGELRLAFAREFLKKQPFDITKGAIVRIADALKLIPNIEGAIRTARFWNMKYNETVDEGWAAEYLADRSGKGV